MVVGGCSLLNIVCQDGLNVSFSAALEVSSRLVATSVATGLPMMVGMRYVAMVMARIKNFMMQTDVMDGC
jgi:hypothetical protein